jgi:hypothetical protein
MITYEQFVEQYAPQQNPFTKEGSFDNCLLSIHGKEGDLAKNIPEKHVWTLISGENETQWLVTGYQMVDREGFIITSKPWETNTIEVDVNDHVTISQAIELCISFYKTLGLLYSHGTVVRWFLQHRERDEKTFTVGKAKYTAIEFYEEKIGRELTDDEQDQIHDYYSQNT